MSKFTGTISKHDIQNFVEKNTWEKWDIVKKIQAMKQDTVKRLMKWLSGNEGKFIDLPLIKWIEKEYFELLQQYDGEIHPDFDYTSERKDIEKMFKSHEFSDDYIREFQDICKQNIIEIPRDKILERKQALSRDIHLWIREQRELAMLRKVAPLLDNRNIENTKSRSILFDGHEFVQSTDKFNIECFFEQDKQWYKHYFTINELLNDLETFWVESGYPVLNLSSLWTYSKEFSTVQKFIKLALAKNILAKYRDEQEVIMYNLKDYEKYTAEKPTVEENDDTKNIVLPEKTAGKKYANKSGILAEKVVEWSFRNFANVDDLYEVKVKKSSIKQDQEHKIDLLIQIQDKASGINIQKELQLTVDRDKTVLENKRSQIYKQKNTRNADLDLLELEFHLLDQKVTLWRNMERPIWWLNDLLSLEDKEFLKKTYESIVKELQEKIK